MNSSSVNKTKYQKIRIKIFKSAPSPEYRETKETKETKIGNRKKRIKIIIEFNYSAIFQVTEESCKNDLSKSIYEMALIFNSYRL